MAKLQTLKPKLQMLDTRRVPTMQAGSWRTDGMTSAQRGYGYKWQKAREAFLREHPLCLMCQERGMVTLATVVDHIVPHRGDQSLFWRRSNWQPLCATHHSRDKQQQEARESLARAALTRCRGIGRPGKGVGGGWSKSEGFDFQDRPVPHAQKNPPVFGKC